MYMGHNKKKDENLKEWTYFNMIWNYDHFSWWKKKLIEFVHFKIFIFHQQWWKHMWYIMAIISILNNML
jgi:hypothetical protein